jgi:hypothetical protein
MKGLHLKHQNSLYFSASCIPTNESLLLGVKKQPVVPVPDRPYFFLPTLEVLFFQSDWPCDPIFSRWLRAARTACQNAICCRTNYWTKLPKFVHRKYASLVNIDVGTRLQIAQQKTAKTMKKIFKKKCISDLPTLIFSRYETGTTGFFYALSTLPLLAQIVQILLITCILKFAIFQKNAVEFCCWNTVDCHIEYFH